MDTTSGNATVDVGYLEEHQCCWRHPKALVYNREDRRKRADPSDAYYRITTVRETRPAADFLIALIT